jgi:site-specific recombinase XerD
VTTRKLIPPKVHIKDGRYYYVDRNKWMGLSRVEDGLRELHRRLAILTDQPPNTLAGIFAAYADSAMRELKPATQKQYTYFLFGILTRVFGHVTPAEIDDSTIAQFLETRKQKGAAVSGNRERACLSSVFEYAMRQGWARRNPCRGVRRNKERGSTVYVESSALSTTIDRAPEHFARAMQLAYLTGMRGVDLALLEVSAVTPKGLEYTESKTKKRVIMAWTDTLRALVREILEARHERINRPYANKYKKPRVPQSHNRLLVNRLGNPLTERGIISNMQRLDPGFTFRHIRPKAQTDGGDDRNVLGHIGQMRERYTRRRKLVPVR